MDEVVKRLKRDASRWDVKFVVVALLFFLMASGPKKVVPVVAVGAALLFNALVYGSLYKGNDTMRRVVRAAHLGIQTLLLLLTLGATIGLLFYFEWVPSLAQTLGYEMEIVGLFFVGLLALSLWFFWGSRTTRRQLKDDSILPFFLDRK